VIAEAEASGHPLLDPLGRRRSPVTLPEYRRGRAPANKGRRFPIEILTGIEVLAILDALPRTGAAAVRNRALIVVMYRGGLRVAEALALRPKDIDLALGAVTVLDGKGAKRRVAAIDRAACRYIEAWLCERARLDLDPDAPLFCGTIEGVRGRPVSRPYVTEMLKRYARKAGIQKRVHPHGLRHAHAFELGQEGVPVGEIQAQLGHEDLAMTARYIHRLSPKERLERIGGRAWQGQPVPVPPLTGAATSAGEPVRTSSGPPTRLGPREPKPREPIPGRAPAGEGAKRVLDIINANGGSATQVQLRRALGIKKATVVKHLHCLHEQGLIIRAGLDGSRSIIWKTAPPPLIFRPVMPYKQAPRGEGPQRVLDAIEALGGRASQAQLARLLGIAPGTVHSHCLILEREGQLEQGALDKTTSHRGSQIWRVPPMRAEFGLRGGYSMRISVPSR
jgi:DNA-binding MarR family transcriptional regulator